MQNAREYFKNKRITVMRIGLLGRGVGDAAFLAECGADVLVVDDASQEEMQSSVDALKDYKNITFKFGPYDTDDFTDTDMVLKGAGALFDSLEISAALAAGVPVEMSASLFARLSGIPIIGVTGTRGKSTVTHMIHHVLSTVTKGAPVLLGGNVRGVSNLQLFNEMRDDSIAVMELDSWQLQGFGYAQISPHIAVFTNFLDDHLNYYHGDREAYFADKANIFLFQEESDVLVTTPEVFGHAQTFANGRNITLGQEVILADASVFPEDVHLAMLGEHNKRNAALAYEALRATSLSDTLIFDGLATFPGVPGRLEFLGEKNGIKIYNDNNATTPEATIAALTALTSAEQPTIENKKLILIMGGADKQLDLTGLLNEVLKYCKKVVLLPGTGTEKFLEIVQKEHGSINRNNFVEVASLPEAVEAALTEGECGDTILFSPACASFGPPPGGFKNEYDRGEKFLAAVGELVE